MHTPQPAKMAFIDVFRQSQIGLETLINRASKAGIAMKSVDAMIVGNPVAPNDAKAVLTILSQWTGKTWNLDTVLVTTFPLTFLDLFAIHHFDATGLSERSGVPLVRISQMLRNEPVPKGDALLVLQALSELLGRAYALDHVAVKLSEEGKSDNQAP